MAKNNNYKNRQNSGYNSESKAKKRSKGIIGVIAAITASALILGAATGVMGYGTNGFKDWSFSKFVDKTQPNAPLETDNNGGAVISDDGESNGISLMSARVAPEEYADYGIDTQSVDSVFNLSVTYVPENTTFQQTTYSIAFKNPNSDWAKGKNVTDYATIMQSSEGSKDAQLTVQQSFSEQIIVTARSERNSDIYAKITVDYVCEYFVGWLGGYHPSVDDGLFFDAEKSYFSYGTIAPEMAGNLSIIFRFDDFFINYMKSYGFEVQKTYEIPFDEDIANSDSDIISFIELVRVVGGYNKLSPERKSAYDIAIGNFYGDFIDGDYAYCRYDFKFNRIYDGVNYGTVEVDDYADMEFIDYSKYFEVKATNMTPNNGSIVAG